MSTQVSFGTESNFVPPRILVHQPSVTDRFHTIAEFTKAGLRLGDDFAIFDNIDDLIKRVSDTFEQLAFITPSRDNPVYVYEWAWRLKNSHPDVGVAIIWPNCHCRASPGPHDLNVSLGYGETRFTKLVEEVRLFLGMHNLARAHLI